SELQKAAVDIEKSELQKTAVDIEKSEPESDIFYSILLILLNQPTLLTNRTHDLTTIDYMNCFKISNSLNLNSLISVVVYFFLGRLKREEIETGVIFYIKKDKNITLKNFQAQKRKNIQFWLTDEYLLFWTICMSFITLFTYLNYNEGNEYFFGRFFNLGMYWLVDNSVGILLLFKKKMFK
ncbi:hypothetical protein M153_20117000640, partial [Pseudoloma neurophilia]